MRKIHLDTPQFRIIIFMVLFILFWVKGIIFLDPDFGWHLRMGQLILQSGIPKTDPFSYTMPSFPFVDHEWLTNVLISTTYPVIGMLGLSFVTSLMVIVSLFIRVKKTWNFWTPIPFLLGAGTLLPSSGVRPQVITWLFFAILINILFEKKLWDKWRFFLPFLFILWANLHGGFAIGIVVLLLSIILRNFEQKKLKLQDIVLFLACVAATFINPYREQLWGEVWLQISDQNLRWSIAEWKLTIIHYDIMIWGLLACSFFAVLKYKKNFSLQEIGIYIFLVIIGILSIRHIPLSTLMTFPILNRGFFYFMQEVKRYKYGIERFNKLIKGTILVVGILFLLQSALVLYGTLNFTEERFYPKTALEFLKTHQTHGQMFAPYGWGGYLIWKYPEKKVFIDGRMPSWRWHAPTSSESNYAFKEYQSAVGGNVSFNKLIEKYQINTVLWPVKDIKQQPNPLDTLEEKIQLAFKIQRAPKKDFITHLKDSGMKEVYQNAVTVIYQK